MKYEFRYKRKQLSCTINGRETNIFIFLIKQDEFMKKQREIFMRTV